MSDIIYYKNGEETFHISPPTGGTKTPKTKLEVKKMTEIEKTKQEIKMLQEKLNKLEEAEKEPDMMLMRQGKVDIVDYDTKVYYRIEYTDSFSGAYVWFLRRRGEKSIRQVRDINVYGVLEDYYQKQVLKQKEDYPYKKQTPEETAEGLRNAMKQAKEDGVFDEPTKPMDEVVDRLVKKYQAQKLWNRVRDELGYSIDLCDEIVDLVEDWILDEQSSAGSQNLDVEFLVEGFNDAIRKMKEMLR